MSGGGELRLCAPPGATMLSWLPIELRRALLEFIPREHWIIENTFEEFASLIPTVARQNSEIFLCMYAAHIGSTSILEWARANGHEWDSLTCAAAASAGQLATLRWLRTRGCPWNSLTCHNAAREGHLESLQWARTEGCKWEDNVCRVAAERGRLAILQWARTNGCPWDRVVCLRVAEYHEHAHVAEWIRAQPD